jgi:hypothetical protein
MTDEDRKARVSAFNAALSQVLLDYQDVTGPQDCSLHGSDTSECDFDNEADDINVWEKCVPQPSSAMLGPFCLAVGWLMTGEDDMSMGMTSAEYYTSEGSNIWEMEGLLRTTIRDLLGVDE